MAPTNRFEKYAQPTASRSSGNRFEKYANPKRLASDSRNLPALSQEEMSGGSAPAQDYLMLPPPSIPEGYKPDPAMEDTPWKRATRDQEQAERARNRSGADRAMQVYATAAGTLPFYDELTGGVNNIASDLYHLPGMIGDIARGDPQSAGRRHMQAADAGRKAREGFNYYRETGREELPWFVSKPVEGAAIGAQMLVPIGAGQAASRAAATTFLGKAGRVLETSGKGMAAGVGYGAAYGAGEGETGAERLKGAGTGAMTGGMAGGALAPAIKYFAPPVIAAIRNPKAAFFPSKPQRAARLVERGMERDGVTWDDLGAAADRLPRSGGGATRETLPELAASIPDKAKRGGTGLKRMARGLHAIPGEASTKADRMFADRRSAMRGDLEAAVAKGTGQKVGEFADDFTELAQQQAARNTANYDKFRDGGINEPVFAQRVEPMLRSERGKRAMLTAAQSMDDQILTLRSRGRVEEADDMAEQVATLRSYANGGNQPPSPHMLDQTIRALDDQIAEAGGHGVYSGRGVYQLQKDMREALGEATDGRYVQAISDFSEGKYLIRDIEAGRKFDTMTETDLDFYMAGRDPKTGEVYRHGPMTPDQVEGFTMGVARKIGDMIAKRDAATLRKLMTDADLQAKLRTIMGDGYAPFMKRIGRITQRQDFAGFIQGGSPTARIQQDIADLMDDGGAFGRTLDDMSRTGSTDVLGSLKRQIAMPVLQKLAELDRTLRYPGATDKEVNRILGDIFFTPMTKTRFNEVRGLVEGALAKAKAKPLSARRITHSTGVAAGQLGKGAAENDPYVQNLKSATATERASVLDGALIEEFAMASDADAAEFERRLMEDMDHSPEEIAALREIRAALAEEAAQDSAQP